MSSTNYTFMQDMPDSTRVHHVWIGMELTATNAHYLSRDGEPMYVWVEHHWTRAAARESVAAQRESARDFDEIVTLVRL